jgi:transposase
MEDLTGITKNTNNQFLKSWKYYQLQDFIKYKAKQVGIKTLWVNPRNTSITCPICGNISKENRSTENKTKFKCVNTSCNDFDIEKDADVVGATNITRVEGTEIKQNSKQGKIQKAKEKLNK